MENNNEVNKNLAAIFGSNNINDSIKNKIKLKTKKPKHIGLT